jgi:hypothetical protein
LFRGDSLWWPNQLSRAFGRVESLSVEIRGRLVKLVPDITTARLARCPSGLWAQTLTILAASEPARMA